MPVAQARLVPVDTFDESARGAGGFGHSGRQ
jgi:dUTPase